MGYPRKSLICLDDTPYYHVVSRCVRRAWLWGYDAYAGKDYSHRKHWVMQRLRFLSNVFVMDLCAYAIMSNHYHLVLRVDCERGARLTQEDVVSRWTKLYREPPLIQRWREGNASAAEQIIASQLIDRWRRRLLDISWYMRSLNENLARRANAEDECTGRFWEGRFKSQALLDEAGVLTAMAYVDLNPVRAGVAATPEESEFTSIYARIQQQTSELKTRGRLPAGTKPRVRINAPPLLSFRDENMQQPSLPMRLEDYLQLVDWTGRVPHANKSALDSNLPTILVRLQINPDAWRATMQVGGNHFGRAIGRMKRLRAHARKLGQAWIKGLQTSQRLYYCT